MEKYSVLMSVYSKTNTDDLKMSIDSMLNQTVIPEQFVIVLDGPVGQGLLELLATYQAEYSEIFSIVSLKENHGLAYALNEGIKASRNKLIARMDTDDYSLPDRCEKQLKEFESNPNLALLGGNTRHFKESPTKPSNVFGINPTGDDAIKQCIRRNSAFSHPTVMFNKEAVVKCGMYDPQLRRSQDHDLFTRMLAMGYVCRNIDEVLVLYRADNDGKLRNRNKDSCEARVIIQKRIYKRHQCSLLDYMYTRLMVFAMKNLPEQIYVWIYSHLKEKKQNN